MKRILLLLLLIISLKPLSGQKPGPDKYSAIDKKALQLPDSLSNSTADIARYFSSCFNTDRDITRAIFIWVATNIQYDVENMYAMNFYEETKEKIAKPLRTKKGICENYAALFNDICIKSNIKSFVIEGYTKQNGFADFIPHAWCGALVDSSWVLFDPTWGSGYMKGGKFVRKINNDYYLANPQVMIRSHMPFDYLWQFLNYPVTNQEFYEEKTQLNKSKAFFNFDDSIKSYEHLGHIGQLISSAYRIEKNGIKNSMIFDRLQHIKLEIENDRQSKIVNLYNAAVVDYNEGIRYINDFINYRNKQFQPKKTDPEIQAMIDIAAQKLEETKLKLARIENPDANIANQIKQLVRASDDAASQVKEQQDWLKLYFSKGKSGRKSMFYERKITWFGIPLN